MRQEMVSPASKDKRRDKRGQLRMLQATTAQWLDVGFGGSPAPFGWAVGACFLAQVAHPRAWRVARAKWDAWVEVIETWKHGRIKVQVSLSVANQAKCITAPVRGENFLTRYGVFCVVLCVYIFCPLLHLG